MRQVIIDLDGVMFNTHKELECLVRMTYPDFRMNKVYTWDFNKSLESIPKDYLSKYLSNNDLKDLANGCEYLLKAKRSDIYTILSSSYLYKAQQFVSGSRELVRNLISSSKGISVVFSTSVINGSSANDIANIKKTRIAEAFKGYNYRLDIHFSPDKPYYTNAVVVIDDNIANLVPYVNSNTNLLLIDAPFNKFELNPQYQRFKDRIIRVKNIREAMKYCSAYVL